MLVRALETVTSRLARHRSASTFEQLRVLRLVSTGMRVTAVALGGVHTLAAVRQHSMNADGIVYLDIGDAYLRGDWAVAINPVWSPLYSWVLGLVVRIRQGRAGQCLLAWGW